MPKRQEKLAYLFPGQGQGTVMVGMGQELFKYSPKARKVIKTADEILGWPLSKLCFEGPEEELRKTPNAQLAVFVMSLAGLAILSKVKKKNGDLIFLPKGKAPAYLAGHSIGYFAALVAAGVITFRPGLLLVTTRGILMGNACERNPGKMLVLLGVGIEAAKDICSQFGVQVAGHNEETQVVLSGPLGSMDELERAVKEQRLARVLSLKTEGGGFHSECMRSAQEDWRRVVAQIRFKDPRIPVIGNTQAQIIATAEEAKIEAVEQLCSPVLWFQTVKALDKLGVTTALEMCGEVLTNLAKRRRFRRLRKILSVTANAVKRLASRRKKTAEEFSG